MVQVLELFSGVGGLRLALESVLLREDLTFVSYEINETAVSVYNHNFSESSKPRNILGLTEDTFSSFDILLMSPACQPFTVQKSSLQLDLKDSRCSPLLHLMNLIRNVKSKGPKIIFMENVAAFQGSEAHKLCLESLSIGGYSEVKEFILNPSSSLAIPNSRNRFFLVASRLPQGTWKNLDDLDTLSHGEHSITLDHFIQQGFVDKSLILSPKIVCKYGQMFDIVTKNDNHSCCFTKNYARFYQGTGSILCLNEEGLDALAFAKHNYMDCPGQEECLVRHVNLRFFSPKEIQNLLGFPDFFNFPDNVSRKKQYQLLGNSVNVKLVEKIMSLIDFSEI